MLDTPTTVGIAGKAGSQACLMAHTAVGRSGQLVGKRQDHPSIGNNVILMPGATVLGGVNIQSGYVVATGSKIRKQKDIV